MIRQNSGPYAAQIMRNAKEGKAKRDRLAGLIADGMTIKDAAAHMGICATAATKHWRRIRDDLGWQAR